jgi:hypothetical protein
MATLRITEYAATAQEYPSPIEPPLVTQTALTPSGTSGASAAMNASTRIVRLSTDVNCHVLFGTTPVATAACTYLAAGTIRDFNVVAGAAMKVAVIT